MSNGFEAMILYSLLALGTGVVMLLLSYYLPILLDRLIKTPFTKRRRGKLDPYECGVEPAENARVRFSVKFYVVALLFILFDIETVFLIPWAVAYKSILASPQFSSWFVFGEAMVFVGVLGIGLLYIWKRGALEW